MNQRLEKINELVIQQLSQIIRQEIEFPNGCMVTLTEVQTSPDIKTSKVFFSVLPDNFRGTALEVLRKKSNFLTQELKKRLKTKFTPNLNFVIDEAEVYAAKIDKLLDEIK